MNHAIPQIEQYLPSQNIRDRRTAPRFDASAIPGYKCINQIGGSEVKLINISRCGALIESCEYMPLGSSISLQIVTAEAVHIIKGQIIGRTIHYRTSSMNEKVLQHQSAIAFDEDFTILPAGPDEGFTLHL